MILCCGEALIDMLPRVTTLGEAGFAPYPGGAVFNTAVALGRLGAPAGFLCGISTDFFGEMLVQTLSRSGVSSDLCPRSDQPTTLAFARLVEGQAQYAFHDENSAMRVVGPDVMPDIGPGVRALFLGGISLVAEPCGAGFEALAIRHALSRVVMLDPNIRPGFVRHEAAYRARLARLIAVADIVKLSDEDLRWLCPGQAEGDAIADLLGQGPALVLITRGAAGADAYGAFGCLHQPARPAVVVDTIGAGDTFNAGVLCGLDRAGCLTGAGLRALPPDALRSALDLAARAAAGTAARAGADPPWLADLQD